MCTELMDVSSIHGPLVTLYVLTFYHGSVHCTTDFCGHVINSERSACKDIFSQKCNFQDRFEFLVGRAYVPTREHAGLRKWAQ